MFCTGCGTQVAAGQAFCPQCGKPQPATAAPVYSRRDLTWHLNLLAIFWFIIAALWTIPAVVLLAIGAGAGFLAHPESSPAAFLGPLFFYCLGGIIAVIAAVAFYTAWGLHKLRPWGRTLAIVMGIVSLLHAPVGTALGIYTLIVLAPADAGREYDRLATQAQMIAA